MPHLLVEPEDAQAIERMLDDGAPQAHPLRVRRRRTSRFPVPTEPATDDRSSQLGVTRRLFRLYCTACGRSTEGLTVPERAGRCASCGGTMLLELTAD